MRGYQKRIVCLKKTGSPLIEEAYFLLSDGACLEGGREKFLREANRIIEENTGEKRKKDGRVLHFCQGALSSAAILVAVFAVILIFR